MLTVAERIPLGSQKIHKPGLNYFQRATASAGARARRIRWNRRRPAIRRHVGDVALWVVNSLRDCPEVLLP